MKAEGEGREFPRTAAQGSSVEARARVCSRAGCFGTGEAVAERDWGGELPLVLSGGEDW